jgi:hypothetical protein
MLFRFFIILKINSYYFLKAFLGITLLKYRKLTIEQTEKRLGLIGEILTCIKCIKLNAWELLFYRRVCGNLLKKIFLNKLLNIFLETRDKEKHYLRIAGYTQSLMIAAGAIVPSIATIVMVLAIVLSGSDLKASDVFFLLFLFFYKFLLKIYIFYNLRLLVQ